MSSGVTIELEGFKGCPDQQGAYFEFATYDPNNHLNLIVQSPRHGDRSGIRTSLCLSPRDARKMRNYLNEAYPDKNIPEPEIELIAIDDGEVSTSTGRIVIIKADGDIIIKVPE